MAGQPLEAGSTRSGFSLNVLISSILGFLYKRISFRKDAVVTLDLVQDKASNHLSVLASIPRTNTPVKVRLDSAPNPILKFLSCAL